MGRNCNLELRLVPPSPYIFSDHNHQCQEKTSEENTAVGEDLKDMQKLTIFYDGTVSVCDVTELQVFKIEHVSYNDVTELQARTIIKLASEEIEEKWRRTPGLTTSLESPSPLILPPMYSPSGLSMKRSLQRFLQKRKNRMQATSPYH